MEDVRSVFYEIAEYYINVEYCTLFNLYTVTPDLLNSLDSNQMKGSGEEGVHKRYSGHIHLSPK